MAGVHGTFVGETGFGKAYSSGSPERGVDRLTLDGVDTGGGEELKSAMQELDELRSLAVHDERDSWRIADAQRRPTTAPSERPAVPPNPLAAVEGGVGGSGGGGAEGGGGETEAELRARLSVAENVMRKLYRKTTQLEEQLATSPQRPQTAAAGTREGWAADGAGGASPTGEQQPSTSEAQALFLLQQKETDLQKMRDYTSQLASRLETLSNDQLAMKNDGQQAATAARNAEYRDRYMRMRGEYRQLLRSRTDSIKKAGKLSQEQERNVLLEQLDAALKDEADLHKRESQRLNEELYLQEKKNCDAYVEKRLLQDRLSALEQEMAARDDLEGEIDGKMVALFNRLKQLEDANLMLEQDNESLKGKLGQPEEKPAAPVNAD